MTNETTASTSVRPVLELNEKNIKAAQPGDILRDAKIKGLQLRCFPNKKVFYLYFRTKTGVERKPKLDAYGKITLDQARTAAQDMLGQVAAGRDPVKEREEAKAEWTLTELWNEWRDKRGAKKKSADEDKRLWVKKLGGVADGDVEGKPTSLAAMKLSEITYQVCFRIHADVSKAGAPVSANRVLALLSTLFNFAVAPLRRLKENPTEGIEHNPETKRKRYVLADEAPKIYEQMQLLARAKDNQPGIAFIWLLLLSGARKGEIAKAKWTQLQGDKLVLTIHKADQTGEDRVIQLAPEAMEVIESLRKVSILGGTITGIKDPKNLWDTIRTNAGCPDLRMHDLRHSFMAAVIGSGHSLAQGGELLGHHDAKSTKRYSHLEDEAAASVAAAAAGHIVGRMRRA